MVVPALDCIQKLIETGYVTNNSWSASHNKRLIDVFVETVCGCFTGLSTITDLELPIIKVLETVMASKYVCIH